MNKERNIIITLGIIILVLIAYRMLFVRDLGNLNYDPNDQRVKIDDFPKEKFIPTYIEEKTISVDDSLIAPDKDEKLHGDKILHFKSKEEMDEFLRRAKGNDFEIVKTLDGLNIARVRFVNSKNKADFLARFNEISYISQNDPISIPDPLVATGAAGFNSHPLDFLGITNNNGWGQGVKVAVIDSGVVEHPALKGKVSYFDLLGSEVPITSFHGTAVASLIAGDGSLVRGISPGAELLSIRALNGDGSGDAFTVAEGIYLAVQNGAQVINLSLGTSYDNGAIREAVLYAQRHGVILVAAVGNDGVGQVSYPANYPGVIAVSANDANENFLTFSNRGENVNISAPGLELTAAGLNNEVVLFTGTSASAPLVTGTVARMLQQNPNLTYYEILTALRSSANEAGPPGDDVYFGEGILNVGRLENMMNRQFVDVAASNFYLQQLPNGNQVKLYFVGENRGTVLVDKIDMKISYPGFERTYIFRNIAGSQTFYETMTFNLNSTVVTQGQEILMQVRGVRGDQVLINDIKSVRIQPNNQ